MSLTILFGTIYRSYCTILANFYLYLQYFQQKNFSFSNISRYQTNPSCINTDLPNPSEQISQWAFDALQEFVNAQTRLSPPWVRPQLLSKLTSIEPCLLRLSRYRGCYYLLGMIWVGYCLYISKYCYAAFNCGDQRRIVDCRVCDAIVNNISNTNLSKYI